MIAVEHVSRRRSKDWSQVVELHTIEEKPSLSVGRLLSLTCGIGGLQIVWATIFTNGTPYLLSLGLSRSLTPLIWSAAPVCGCLVQPYVGLLSDHLTNALGRRRPFIIIGTLGVVLSLLGLGWAGTASLLLGNSAPIQGLAPLIAVLSFWTLSLAIQPLQCGLRALILDVCPSHQQSRANAWASRFTAIGNILGCLVGSLDVAKGTIGGEVLRFRLLCILSMLSLSLTSIITCTSINETSHQHNSSIPPFQILAMSRKLHSTFSDLPARTKTVFTIQFLSWTSWFGFLFYSASYVGELFARQMQGHETLFSSEVLDNSGRAGALASLVVSIVAFASTTVLPVLIAPTRKNARRELEYSRKPTLETIWALALAAGSLHMLSTVFVSDPQTGLVLITAMGFPWAVATWAQYVLIAADALNDVRGEEDDDEVGGSAAETVNGTIMGLQNIAISAPQILGAGLSAVVIRIAQDWGSQDSFGWVLRVGAVSFAAASVFAFRLRM